MGKVMNVKNYYLAEVEVSDDGIITHGAPEKVFGVMKATSAPQTASTPFYEEGVQTEQIDKTISYNLAFDHGDLPNKWKAWMNGYNYTNGVMNDEGDCAPKPFAVGWEKEKIRNGKHYSQMVWFLFCQAKPIEENEEQSTNDIKISNDTINCVALKKDQFENRAFTMIDTSETSITEEMQGNFFKKVQTTDTIEAPAKA